MAATTTRTTTVVVAVALVLAWAVTLRPVVLGGPATYVTVAGTSMEPTYDNGDLVVARRADGYDVGEAIVYAVGDELVIHRVVGVDGDGYLTQGDNRDRIDPWVPTDDHVLGRAWLHVPRVGVLFSRLEQPWLRGLVALVIAGLLVAPPSRARRRGARRPTRTSAAELDHAFLTGSYRTPAPRSRRRPTVRTSSDRRGPRSVTWRSLAAVIAAAVVASLSGGWALAAWSSDGTVAPVAGPEHRLTVTHTGYTDRSQVYPSGVVGPHGPDAASDDPLYRALLERVVVQLDHTVEGPVEPADGGSAERDAALTADLSGTVAIDVVATAGDGWEHRIEAVRDELDGATWSGAVTIDLAAIDQVMFRHRELVGSRGEHDIALDISFVLDAADGPAVFTPTFGLEPAGELWAVDGDAVQTAAVGPSRTPQTRGPLGADLLAERWSAAALTLLALLALAWSAMVRAGWTQETTRALVRHRRSLVAVPAGTRIGGRPITVERLADLVRLAHQERGVILHEDHGDGVHRLSVPAGDLTYVHVLSPVESRLDGDAGVHTPQEVRT